MNGESLEEAIQRSGNVVELLRNSPAKPTIFPITPEFTNWRSEQRSWRETVALLDQSHHMTDLYINGPDALQLLSDTGVNKFANFKVNTAKQFVAVNADGYLIGDAILAYLAEGSFNLVGHPTVLDWVQFHLETGNYDATTERDDNSLVRKGNPKNYRYELQGPAALALTEKLIGGPVPDVKFFHMTDFTIAGCQVRAIRHGIAGQAGFEIFGPWADGERVREAILEAGEEFGLRQVGAKAYSTSPLPSGWVPTPVPAIFTGDTLAEYRRWLPVNAVGSLGGSFASQNIADYYVTPWDLNYGRVVSFDHDFIGRDALERMRDTPPREKVTLVWNSDDVADVFKSLGSDGLPAKYFDLPKARYAFYQVDQVLADGSGVGLSFDCGYVTNEQAFISLATIDKRFAEPGTQVSVLWGEEPNSAKPQVEAHRQVEIRATVAPVPYSDFARETYRSN